MEIGACLAFYLPVPSRGKEKLKLKTHVLVALALSMFGSGSLFADNLSWTGPNGINWSGFYTSPYTASDNSVNPAQSIQLFCLDFNDEIAPPFNWTASINSLTSANVSGFAQYGGNYNNLVNAQPGATGADDVSGPPFAFTGATAGPDTVSMAASSQAYTRYLEAAWLFTDITSALPGDPNSSIIAQVAAWDLFVNSSNINTLQSDINGTGGTFSFSNYLTWSGANYNTAGSNSTTTATNLTFAEAVIVALQDAQNAVVNEGFGPGSFDFGSWSIVTATPTFVVDTNGHPAQEFLSPNAVPDAPGVPEPQSFVLLGTIIAFLGIRRNGMASLGKKLGLS